MQKVYLAPSLQRLGSLRDLTESGLSPNGLFGIGNDKDKDKNDKKDKDCRGSC